MAKSKKIKKDKIDREIEKTLELADKLEKEQYEDTATPEPEPEFISIEESELVGGEGCYNIFCQACGCEFEAYESECGKPPFDVECPECGTICSVN